MEAMILLSQWREIELICEIWKPIPEFPDYDVSTLGRVRSWRWTGPNAKSQTPRLIAIIPSRGQRKPYCRVHLSNGHGDQRKISVHRLVATVFINNPDDRPEVNHLCGYVLDNRAAGLEWVTRVENQHHSRNILHNGLITGSDAANAEIANAVKGIRYLRDELGWSLNRITQFARTKQERQ